MSLKLQTTIDSLLFVLLLTIEAPAAVKHACSVLIEKGVGGRGPAVNVRGGCSQAASPGLDLL